MVHRYFSLVSAIVLSFGSGCGPEGTASTQAPHTPSLVLRQASALSARNIKISWEPIPSGRVRIDRARADGPFEHVANKAASHGRFLDLALTPETTYRYRLSYCLTDTACHAPLMLEPLTTPKTRLPAFTIDIPPEGTQDDIVVFGIETLDPDALDLARMAGVDRQGIIIWEYAREKPFLGPVTEVHWLEDRSLATGHSSFFVKLDLDGTELYRYEGNTAHHDIDPLSNGRFIFLTFDAFADDLGGPILGDGIEIVQEGQSFPSWTWRARDHIPRTDRNPVDWENYLFGIGRDWTHANALTMDEEANKIYVNIRNLNRIYCLDYPSGEVLWVMGDGGDFGQGLFAHSHDPVFLSSHRVLVFDNGALRPEATHDYSRIIEIEFDAAARHAEIVWEYRETPDFFSFAQGAIGIQPNGNLFVTDGINRRIFEVTRDKKKIWQMRLPPGTWTYKSITVPRSEFEDW